MTDAKTDPKPETSTDPTKAADREYTVEELDGLLSSAEDEVDTLEARIADLERENAALRSLRTRWRIGWGEHSGVALGFVAVLSYVWLRDPAIIPPAGAFMFVGAMALLAFVQRENAPPPLTPDELAAMLATTRRSLADLAATRRAGRAVPEAPRAAA